MDEPKKCMPDSMPEVYTRADRDLIVVTNATVLAIKDDIREIKNNLAGRVDALERTKANGAELDKVYMTRVPQWSDFTKRIEVLERAKVDHTEYDKTSTRLDVLEKWQSWVIGIGATVFILGGMIASLITYIYFSDLNIIKSELKSHIESTQAK